jgi:nucleolar complex protein 2
MAQSKRTKKFESTKLKDVIKHRKEGAKVKQRQQMSAKRKERNARDNAPADGIDGVATTSHSKNAPDTSLGDMSMDQFFQGGFEIPERNKKRKTKPKTGKRKRTPVDEDAEDAEDDATELAPAAEDSNSEDESGDDAEAHKEQLAGLAEKDPEFYKYLKENDAELLDFAEDADLAEIDALSASEDEETPRKKKKQKSSKKADAEEEEETTGNEVTKKLVQKWSTSMKEAHSLRAMKEVVLAFRAAAHLNDETPKAYKYTISDSDGESKHMYNKSSD